MQGVLCDAAEAMGDRSGGQRSREFPSGPGGLRRVALLAQDLQAGGLCVAAVDDPSELGNA